VEPLACCIKAVLFHTKIVPGDWVLISGPGPIGLICADLARLAGGRVIVCGTDRDAHRLAMAKSAEHTVDVTRENISEFVRSITGDGADIVIECAGAAASIDQCLDAVRPLGTFTQVALVEHPVEVNWGKIIYKQLSVNSSIAQNWPSWQRALEMVIAQIIDPTAYISHRLPLENWEQAFDGAERQEGLKYVLYP
jgi:L-iditol 2-dehydrogenase